MACRIRSVSIQPQLGFVGFGDWLASLTGEFSLDASLYAGQPNSRISTNQLYLGFMVRSSSRGLRDPPREFPLYIVCKVPHSAVKHAQSSICSSACKTNPKFLNLRC